MAVVLNTYTSTWHCATKIHIYTVGATWEAFSVVMIYMKSSQCTDYTAMTVELQKAIMNILKKLFKIYTEQTRKTADLHP